MNTSSTIYVADDDPDILGLVSMFLRSEGYEIRAFATGDELYTAFESSPADLVIMDIMMPGTDGLNVCRKLREVSTVPIILLTARESDADYVTGINVGADDYLTKPFRPTILTMRVKALLRRREMSVEPPTETNGTIQHADLTLDTITRTFSCNGNEIPFTGTEYSCMEYLIKHFDETVSREALLTNVWGYPAGTQTRVADETIRRIRKKMQSAGATAQIINKWGYGYRLSDTPDKES